MTTIYDVARRARVSSGTVSRYLNGHGYVSQATRDRLQAVIAELGYTPSGIARGLTTKRSNMIGFVVSDLANPFVSDVVRGVQDLADDLGYCTLVYNTDGNGQREARALTLLNERRVDGLIIMPPETPEGNQCIRDLHKRGVPIVLIGRQLDQIIIDRVSTDTYGGSAAAMRHLVGLGHRRIAFLSTPLSGTSRKRGYTDILQEAGIAADPALIQEVGVTRESGSEAMAHLLSLADPPTAVFAINDMLALGAMEEAFRWGKQVPEDISIVGFDDIVLAAHARPPLTTVAQPKHLLGRTAAELLLAHFDTEGVAPREVRLPCTLVTRGSTARMNGTQRG